MKTCPDCRTAKPLAEYWRKRSAKDGRQTRCKPCQSARNEAWAAANPERRRVTRHAAQFVRKYSMTLADRERMLSDQGGACAICRTDTPGGRWQQWHVDHCHTSGAVRGLLCNDCNAGIGILRDDPARLRAAADYIERAAANVGV